MKNEISVQEKIRNAERLAKLIAHLPQDEEAFLVAVMNAYADGLMAGRRLESRRNHLYRSDIY